jgi:hypothetical protein
MIISSGVEEEQKLSIAAAAILPLLNVYHTQPTVRRQTKNGSEFQEKKLRTSGPRSIQIVFSSRPPPPPQSM